jgi:hypothetical protein
VDFVALPVEGGEARGRTDRAVDVDHTAADSANQMVVVVANAILESRRRPGGLDAAEKSSAHQHGKRVVHRLERDGANLTPDEVGYRIRRDVGMTRHRAEHGQSLGGYLDAALAQELGGAVRHAG